MRLLFIALAACLSFSASIPQDPVSLKADGRVGRVVDQQGLASLRPVARQRWTPIARGRVLMPGDQVRSNPRGANAVEIELGTGPHITMGPGALIEIQSGGQLRLFAGDLAIEFENGGELSLQGPGGFSERIDSSRVYRAEENLTRRLDANPRWLEGYRNSTTDEWLGSLITEVDGREVPLSVGYHKVEVDIKDQIARSTIEQSFVNSTKQRLEGVFYFPLPAGASISGFGMWIGGELVEADIVEKQRAREIFEDILRRRKDPGLLEWSGGNLFKARVFPIEPQSEKRVRIRYTQTLPLQGSKLKYSYALNSELLRSRPLRDLSIRVNVDSAIAIKELNSTSHELRIRKTANNAVAEFDAREFSPDKDFELEIELANPPAITVLPHRRAADGYFMMLLNPPGESSGLKRELLPEGAPLDLLILADTSASMDLAARRVQEQVLEGLLSMLGEEDRFQLMTVDLAPRPFRSEPLPATTANVAGAMRFVEARESMGWTDLDRAFAKALSLAGPKTRLIYLGDGIGTTGDASPEALAQRLRSMGANSQASAHAISTSSTYELPVLEAIASIGAGSLREAGSDPLATAQGFLAEIAQPVIKDLSIDFEGLQVARVYPEVLPNLAAGAQQVILGRYQPGSGPQKGRITVRGTLAGEPLQFSTELELPESDAGNSFIPRLWARKHVDALLREGNNPLVIADIVSFSEEYGIMTPYTSLLVLESDADRERYGVTRRVKMRDGEQFFAEGRDRANQEILRQQMKLAKTWRLQIWRRFARELVDLGANLYQQQINYAYGGEVGAGGRRRGLFAGAKDDAFLGGYSREYKSSANAPVDKSQAFYEDLDFDPDEGFEKEMDELVALEEELNLGIRLDAAEPMALRDFGRSEVAAKRVARQAYLPGSSPVAFGQSFANHLVGGRGAYSPRYDLTQLLFPAWIGLPADEPEIERPDWPAAVFAALDGLDRRAALGNQALRLRVTDENLHRLRGHRVQYSVMDAVISQDSWYLQQSSRGAQRMANWLYDGKRGSASLDFQTGRRRDVVAADGKAWPLPLKDYSSQAMIRRFAKYSAELQNVASGNLLITFKAAGENAHRLELEIDPAKKALIELRNFRGEDLTQRSIFSEFEEVAGQWWPGSIRRENDKGRVLSRRSLKIAALDADGFARQVRIALESQGDVLFLERADPDLKLAKQAIHDGTGDYVDHLRVLLQYAETQQWDLAWEQWHKAEKSIATKPAMPWMRSVLLSWSRRGEDLYGQVETLVDQVASSDRSLGVFPNEYLLNMARSMLQVDEQGRLIDRLRSSYFAQTIDQDWCQQQWERRRAQFLQQRGQYVDAMAIYEKLASSHPEEIQDLLQYLQLAASQGRADQAVNFGRQRLRDGTVWEEYEFYQLYDRLSNLLWNRRQLDSLHELCAEWIARNPTQEAAYVRYLSVLMFLGREVEADRWIDDRLAETLADDDPQAKIARMGAAIQVALGQGWQFYSYNLEEKWLPELRDFAIRLAQSESKAIHLAGRIISNHFFRQSDAYEGLRKRLSDEMLQAGKIAEFSIQRLQLYVSWLNWAKDQVSADLWQHVSKGLYDRWLQTDAAGEQAQIASILLSIYYQHGDQLLAIGFLRERLARVEKQVLSQVARELMTQLVTQPWTEELEAELFALVPKLSFEGQEADMRAGIAAMAIRQLAASLQRMRTASLLGGPEVIEVLPRAELRAKQVEVARAVFALLQSSFSAAAARANEIEKPWYAMEALCFMAQQQRDLTAVDAEAREILADLMSGEGNHLDRLRRERCSVLLSFVATRRNASEDLATQLLAFYREAGASKANLLDWRYQIFRLLVVLDRPEELLRELQDWDFPGQVASEWKIAEGYLLAELGRVREAVEVFELIAAKNELGPKEFEVLGSWYLVLNEDERGEAAMRARYQAMPEHVLSQRLYQMSNRLSRQGEGVPETFDPDSLRILQVLLAKATQPQNYIHQINDLYSKVKDFRLLACIADGVRGHSPQRIYPFLAQTNQIIKNIHEEATCDLLVARIAELTDGSEGVDRRALLLLTALIESRAAEVLNSPGPHIANALSAMRQAFVGDWQSGERRLMASYLASLGRITAASLAAEQLRQLRELLEAEQGVDRLKVAFHLCQTLWNYGEQDEAEDRLWLALQEHHGAAARAFSQESNQELSTLLYWWQARGRLARSEDFLEKQLSLPGSDDQKDWFLGRLFEVYNQALRGGNRLSIGSREQLYENARPRISDALFRSGPQQLSSMMQQFLSLHRQAAEILKLDKAGTDLEAFAYEKLGELVTRSANDRQNIIRQIGEELRRLNGHYSGMRFLITQIEGEANWLSRVGRSGWQSFGYQLAQWRTELRDLGDLEGRLLGIVSTELERDLLSRNATNRNMYQIGNSYFWAKYQPRFVQIANRVLGERASSAAHQLYVAEYFWHGLQMYPRAIEVLFDAHRRERLSVAGQFRLAGMLHLQKRWGESIDLLRALVEHQPEHLDYRTHLVVALHHSKQDEAAKDLLSSTETRFRLDKRWTADVISNLARTSLQCSFWSESAAYYEELIPLHQRSAAKRGIGDGVLSSYYGQLAEAQAGMREWRQAVESASAAVVSWGRNQQSRQSAISSLESVMRRIPDLSKFADQWAAEVAAKGLDSAIIRRAMGRIFLEQRVTGEAISQLIAARDLQSMDRVIHADLLRAYDQAGDEVAATEALKVAVRFFPLELDLYEDLARRLDRLGREGPAERAWTSLVEVLPHEADSHRRLALAREEARRFGEAIVQWEQVLRVRSREPEGWFGLARAQRQAGQVREAQKTLQYLLEENWDERFGDVRAQAARELQALKLSRPPR